MVSSTADDETTSSPPYQPPRSLSSRPRPTSSPSPSLSIREDCWSEGSTHALIDAWGSRHLASNRRSLRQQQWDDVAAVVNSAAKSRRRIRRRTDDQCKNRIDTLKKRYKVEKAKTLSSNGAYVSQWPYFSRLDFLIAGGSSPLPTPALTNFPVGRRTARRKRPAQFAGDLFRRMFLTTMSSSSEDEERESSSEGRRERGEGVGELAEAIRQFGEVYERVEAMKQEKMVELEKSRMQFAKDLEFQRLKLLMDTQLQLARIKRSKHNSIDADSYL